MVLVFGRDSGPRVAPNLDSLKDLRLKGSKEFNQNSKTVLLRRT